MNRLRSLKLFDTTLRDGEQAPGNDMTVELKLDLFDQIDAIGVEYIEAGFPAASPADVLVTEELAKRDRQCTLCVFSRPTARDLDVTLAAVDGHFETIQIELLLTGSEIHAVHKRGLSREAIVREAREATAYLRAAGVQDVALGLEDATRGSESFVREVTLAGIEAGASTVVLPDTVGCATPSRMAALVRAVKDWVGHEAMVSVHCHDDLGLSLANALAAVSAGADVVQTTLCGIGERAGNTALEELVATLFYAYDEFGVEVSHLDIEQIARAAYFMLDALGLRAWKHKSILGEVVFATAAGVHTSGVLRDPVTYEFVQPELFGREREIRLGRNSGRANLRHAIGNLGLSCDGDHLDRLYGEFVAAARPSLYNDSSRLVELYEATSAPRTLPSHREADTQPTEGVPSKRA